MFFGVECLRIFFLQLLIKFPRPCEQGVRMSYICAARLTDAPQEIQRLVTEFLQAFYEITKVRVLKILGTHFANDPPVF
jgi:hypothetical protein